MRVIVLLALAVFVGCEAKPVASPGMPATGSSAKGSAAPMTMAAPKPVDKAEVAAQISRLEAKQAAAERARAELAPQFPIESARFLYDDGSPSIELKVTNKTDKAIGRAYFDAIVTSPGRSEPWVRSTIHYQSSAGLQPGESATWLLKSFADDWQKVPKDRDDVAAKVAVYRLDDTTGAPLIAAEEFTELDEENLSDLRQAID
jgi:hypothetical protein